MIARVLLLLVLLQGVGCQSYAEALYDHARKTYQQPPALAPLTPLPSDEHRARWDMLLLVVLLSLEWCMGCALLPVPYPVAPASCLQRICQAEGPHGR